MSDDDVKEYRRRVADLEAEVARLRAQNTRLARAVDLSRAAYDSLIELDLARGRRP